jgi:hypothetical protein
VQTILKFPSVEIKRSDRCNCDNGETLTGGESPGRPNKASTYKSKYKKLKTSSKKVHTPKLIRVLLDSGSDEDLLFHKKGTPKCFPYSTRQVPRSWCTLNGNFHTEGRGKLEFIEYRNSKKVNNHSPDIVEMR